MGARKKQQQKKSAERKAAKRKIRSKRLKQQKSAFRNRTSSGDIADLVDYALEMLENGSHGQARTILDKLYKKAPHNTAVLFGQGVIHTLSEAYDDALAFFERATDIDPTFVEGHFNAAMIHQKQFNIKGMVFELRKVIEFGEADDENVQRARAILSEAEAAIQTKGLTLDEYIQAGELFEKGVNCMENRQKREAVAYFLDVLKIDRHNQQTYGNLGICYACLGERALALRYIDKALELDPDYEPARINRGLIQKMAEGECLPTDRIASVNYYRDSPYWDKSFKNGPEN